MALSAKLTGPKLGDLEAYRRFAVQRLEKAALIASDKARLAAIADLRQQFRLSGLGRLGSAVGSGSDAAKGRGVHRRGGDGFSASGYLFLRAGSDRSRGAIEAYTEGAEIGPRNGRYLWIATDEIPRVTGRKRMTPALYRKNGFEAKIGPLFQVKSVNGNPLLVVNATVSASGKTRTAKARTKTGKVRKGQREKEFIVAFIGIPRTSRKARVSVRDIARRAQSRVPGFLSEALSKS